MSGPARAVAVCLVALLVVAAANGVAGPAIEGYRVSTSLEEELAFYPSGRFLIQASCGFRNLLADLLWFRAIQYYGEHRKTDLIFDKAAHIFRIITDLDPHFIDAYRFGSLVIIEDAFDPGAGYELLRKGIRENPHRWELPFDLGFHHFLQDEFDVAAAWFERASNLAPENERVIRFAANAEKRRGGLDSSEEMWKALYESTGNEALREAALFALKGIRVVRDTTLLAGAAREYRVRAGRWPRSTDQLARAGLIGAVPVEPYGNRYLIQPATGEVVSGFLLAREIRRDKIVLGMIVNRFREERGRLPSGLPEMCSAGLLEEIPSPWGIEYIVDGETGEILAALPDPGLPAGSPSAPAGEHNE